MKDTVAMQFVELRGTRPNSDEISDPPDDIKDRVVPIVLRLLHAKQAEELPGKKWINAHGDSEYLIENEELRDFYGRLIGKIARSHGEPISWVRSELGIQLGALASHDGGEVNGLKLACLLRTADASQIDTRRAPRFERTILKPSGISDLHWSFQGKLAKPRVDRDALVYTSGSPFSLKEADAWWVGFDAIQVADKELHDVDVALEDLSQPRLRARRVRGAQSPKDLSQTMRTEGWDPVDARLTVSNVPRLVQMFGGTRLYGEDCSIAIRELIQNAADAIRARRKLDLSFASSPDGKIVIRLTESKGECWLEIEDNGVGMSERTITGALLDFGHSFWTSDAVRREFPGLMATGMAPTGKFGIGFFSVFMLGDVVRVTSRRYDSASHDNRTLEFRGGVHLRPILRKSTREEAIPSGGTRVSIRLRHAPYEQHGFLVREDYSTDLKKIDLRTMVATICPSLDVEVAVELKGREYRILKADDWLRINPSKLLIRVEPYRDSQSLKAYAANLRPIISSKDFFGRACIRADRIWGTNGKITVGGLSAMKLEFLEGILLGTTDSLARNTASLLAPPEALARWATEQADLIWRSKISLPEQLMAAGVVIACGGNPRKLPIAQMGSKYLNQFSLKKILRAKREIGLFYGEPSFEEETDDCHPRAFKHSFKPSPDVLFLGEIPGASFTKYWWPGKPSYRPILEAVLRRTWKRYEIITDVEKAIGNVDDIEILREVEVLKKSS
jgi:hypothetical protein